MAYPVGEPEVTTSNASPVAGGSVTLTASGFCPGDSVEFVLDPGGDVLGTATVDDEGVATIEAAAPDTAGDYDVIATSDGTDACALTASLGLSVSAPSDTVPATGANTGSTVNLGLAVVAGGLVLVGVAAIRRRQPA
jgi:hypothetical protein